MLKTQKNAIASGRIVKQNMFRSSLVLSTTASLASSIESPSVFLFSRWSGCDSTMLEVKSTGTTSSRSWDSPSQNGSHPPRRIKILLCSVPWVVGWESKIFPPEPFHSCSGMEESKCDRYHNNSGLNMFHCTVWCSHNMFRSSLVLSTTASLASSIESPSVFLFSRWSGCDSTMLEVKSTGTTSSHLGPCVTTLNEMLLTKGRL